MHSVRLGSRIAVLRRSDIMRAEIALCYRARRSLKARSDTIGQERIECGGHAAANDVGERGRAYGS